MIWRFHPYDDARAPSVYPTGHHVIGPEGTAGGGEGMGENARCYAVLRVGGKGAMLRRRCYAVLCGGLGAMRWDVVVVKVLCCWGVVVKVLCGGM